MISTEKINLEFTFEGFFLTEQFLTRASGPEVVENCGKVLINGLLHRVPGDI